MSPTGAAQDDHRPRCDQRMRSPRKDGETKSPSRMWTFSLINMIISYRPHTLLLISILCVPKNKDKTRERGGRRVHGSLSSRPTPAPAPLVTLGRRLAVPSTLARASRFPSFAHASFPTASNPPPVPTPFPHCACTRDICVARTNSLVSRWNSSSVAFGAV